jgi:hypothetical protein
VFVDAGDYGCAALLASCLLDGGDPAWRAAFLGALRADLAQIDAGKRLLESLGEAGTFRTRLEAHAQDVRKR